MDKNNENSPAGTHVGSFAAALASAQPAEAGNANEQWVHLLPSGTFQGRDGRGPWALNDPGAVIEETRRYAGKNLLAVDFEHQIDLSPKNGQPAPAAGWLKGLQARETGLWGLVEWTEKAKAHIDAKEYRYLSPVFNFTPTDGEVTRLLRAALTNNPALELTALARAADPVNDPLPELRQLLALDPEADLAAVVAAVRELVTARQSAQPDPSRYVPIGAFEATAAELQALRRQNEEGDAVLAVDHAIEGGHMLPSWRDWALTLCRSNRPAFDGFIKSVSPFFGALRQSQTGGLPPEARGARSSGTLSEEQQAICRALGHTPDDLNKYRTR